MERVLVWKPYLLQVILLSSLLSSLLVYHFSPAEAALILLAIFGTGLLQIEKLDGCLLEI